MINSSIFNFFVSHYPDLSQKYLRAVAIKQEVSTVIIIKYPIISNYQGAFGCYINWYTKIKVIAYWNIHI